MKLEIVQEKLQFGASKIQQNKYVSAITNGLMAAMPMIIVGAIGSLVNSLPIPAYQEFLVNSGLKEITVIPSEVTTNVFSLYVVFLVASKFAKSCKQEGTPAGLLALMFFLIITPFNYSETLSLESIPASWLGARGLFTAFIASLIVAKIFVLFKEKGWVINMPAGVPPTVSSSFAGLTPALVVAALGILVRYLTSLTSYGDIHEIIFNIIAAPLTNLGGSFPAMIIAILVAHILWLCGVHGILVVVSVFSPIWIPQQMENLAAFNAGQPIPNLVSYTLANMVFFMGSGATLGLAIAMLRAKSEQYKVLGKLSFIPNLFGINEPILFGVPIIMNFTLAIPFILMPLIILVTSYLAMVTGFFPRLTGVRAPLGTPVIIQGLMIGGWQWAVYQVVMIIVSYFVYLPFFKVLDKQALALEEKKKNEEKNNEELATEETA